MDKVRANWPLVVCVLVLLAVVLMMAQADKRLNDGRFVYALDDTYIHMAISKNIVEHGVWGCTRYHFSSSSSSVLWTVLLAGTFLAAGVREWAPLVLNILCCVGFLAIAAGIMKRLRVHPGIAALALVAAIFVTPMPALIFGGMEHSLHAMLTLAFAYVASRLLEDPDGRMLRVSSREWMLVGLAPLLSGARYEGLFLVGIAAVALAFRKRLLTAGLSVVAAVIPIAVFGKFAVAQGWEFLPNSLLLKATDGSKSGLSMLINFFGYQDYEKLLRNHHIFILTIVAVAIFTWRAYRDRTVWKSPTLMLALFVMSMLVHVMYAQLGWLYRYEAYLMAFGLIACTAAAFEATQGLRMQLSGDRIPAAAGAALLAVLLAVPMAVRSTRGISDTVASTHDRYLWHILAAQFVKKSYPQGPIVINDLGAVAFYTDARLMDMFGLGDREPLSFRRGPGGYTAEDLESWAKREKAPIAVFQIEWVEVYPRVPKSWQRVATLVLPPNVAFGDSRMAFFAVDPDQAGRLRTSLRDFYGPLQSRFGIRLLMH